MQAPNESDVETLATNGFGELVDESTLAARLHVSRSTLQTWRYGGRGPRWIKLGRLIRYRVSDVDAFLLANTLGGGA
jgi:predicted DNA-binding transcriptional regulator AlpA